MSICVCLKVILASCNVRSKTMNLRVPYHWILILFLCHLAYSTDSVFSGSTYETHEDGKNENSISLLHSTDENSSLNVSTIDFVAAVIPENDTATERDGGDSKNSKPIQNIFVSNGKNTSTFEFITDLSTETIIGEKKQYLTTSALENLRTNWTTAVTKSDLLTTTTISETSPETEECSPDDCSSPSNCTFMKSSGCIRVTEDGTEKFSHHTIIAPTHSSFIYVEMGYVDLQLNSTITIEFTERKKSQATWLIETKDKAEKYNYVSTGPSLSLHITTEGNWTNATIYYKELEFECNVANELADAGTLNPSSYKGLPYRPNTQQTYHLVADKSKWNESSVLITLSFVDLDEESGDYLLIGAGNVTLSGPPPLYFTGYVSKSRDYYIASDDVYVVFASRASQNKDKKGFSMKWKRTGTSIAKPDDDPDEETITDSVLQSVGICFYNKSFIVEFNTTEEHEGPLQTFREKLATVANAYAKEKKMQLNYELKAFSVKIFRISSIMEPRDDVMPAGGIYTMVTIVDPLDKNTAVFRRSQLLEIIDELEKQDKDYALLGSKVGHCPTVESYLEWYIAAVVLVLVSTVLLILVWIFSTVVTWRGLSFRKGLSRKTSSVCCKTPYNPARQNEYISYTPGYSRPQMLVAQDGEVIALNSNNTEYLRQTEDPGEIVLFDDNWLMRKAPVNITVTADVEQKRPSFMQTFQLPSASTKRSRSSSRDIQMERLLPSENSQPVEHEYDSLNFASKITMGNDEGETRL